MGCLRYNVTHIVLDVQELERDSVDVTAVNGMAYRVASNGRCVEHSTQSTVSAAMRESAWRGGVPRVWAGGGGHQASAHQEALCEQASCQESVDCQGAQLTSHSHCDHLKDFTL